MKACLIDIDGTLVLTGGAGQVAFAETFAKDFGVDQISESVSFAGRSDRAIAKDLMELHGVDPSEDTWKRFQRGYINRLDAALEQCVGSVLPGVVELINQLQQRSDVLVGLLTGNIQQAAEKKLGYYGLWSHFPFGGFGDDHLDRNDIAAEAVAQARRHADTTPVGPSSHDDTIVIIGDTPNDIRCARSVGARAVAVPTGHHTADELRPHEPDLLVETLEDSAEMLAWFDE